MLPPKLTIGPIRALITSLDALVDTHALVLHSQRQTACHFLGLAGVAASRLPDRVTYAKYLSRAYALSPIAQMRAVLEQIYPPTAAEHRLLAQLPDEQMLTYLQQQQALSAPQQIKPVAGLPGLLQQLGQQGLRLAITTHRDVGEVWRDLQVGMASLGWPEQLPNWPKLQSLDAATQMRLLADALAKQWDLPQVVVSCQRSVNQLSADLDPEQQTWQQIGQTMRLLQVQPDQVAFLGTQPEELRCAHTARIRLLLGFSSESSRAQPLQESGAKIVVNSLQQLHFSSAQVIDDAPSQPTSTTTYALS